MRQQAAHLGLRRLATALAAPNGSKSRNASCEVEALSACGAGVPPADFQGRRPACRFPGQAGRLHRKTRSSSFDAAPVRTKVLTLSPLFGADGAYHYGARGSRREAMNYCRSAARVAATCPGTSMSTFSKDCATQNNPSEGNWLRGPRMPFLKSRVLRKGGVLWTTVMPPACPVEHHALRYTANLPFAPFLCRFCLRRLRRRRQNRQKGVGENRRSSDERKLPPGKPVALTARRNRSSSPLSSRAVVRGIPNFHDTPVIR